MASCELQSLLEAITSSDVVENRIQVLTKLEGLDLSDRSDLSCMIRSLSIVHDLTLIAIKEEMAVASVEDIENIVRLQFLCPPTGSGHTIFWEDFTCLDISQCMLNKTILHVAARYLDSDISGCLGYFFSLGVKATIWCGKHLKMTLMSSQDSQEEEHSNLFYQLLLDLLRYSAACFSALARYPILDKKELVVIVEKFTVEQLSLTKASVSEIKRLNSYGLEILKVSQLVLDSVIRLCKVHAKAVNLDFLDTRAENDENSVDCEKADSVNHIVNIIKCTIEQFCELGVLAANDGGSRVTILNSSWKGVVTLLQLGKGALARKLNVSDIILTLISLANESLRCAAETWSVLPMETVSVPEAKRIFLPVKFYLINAVRISSQYPCQAFSVYKDISLCVLKISTFRILLSKEEELKSASEVLVELLEPVSFHLLNSLLNSAQLKHEGKLLILDWLFQEDNDLNFTSEDLSNKQRMIKMSTIFSLSSDDMNGARILLLGRVVLYLNLLKSASDLEEDARLGIARKLGWLLKVLVDEEIYSFCLSLQIPIPYGSDKAPELAYQPMFPFILHALKTFMIAVSSSPAWKEMESFLLENFFHPHFLCWEIVMELWCFLVCHSELDMINDIFENLCSLLMSEASSQSVLVPGSALRKIARSICVLLAYVSQTTTIDKVYNMIAGSSRSQLSSTALVALLMEGFPLNLLSEKMRSNITQRIVTEYFEFIDRFGDASLKGSDSNVFGAPVFALSAALRSLQLSTADINAKTLRFLVAVIHNYRNTAENLVKHCHRRLLIETLGIISNVKHLYASDGMEGVILELQNLVISGPAISDAQFYQCKPNLATFMAGLGHMELTEEDSCAKSSAVWELYHLLLREQHWAFVHLAITAFGYFAARTSCNQLWRFVPPNAALSYDLESGTDANEERFLNELKAFLEKETALLSTTASPEQFHFLVKEGSMLRQKVVQKHQNIDKVYMGHETMEIDAQNQANKRRKLPHGVSQGVALLQSGLKAIGEGLSQMQPNQFGYGAELHDKFMTHFSHLEEVIGHLAGISGEPSSNMLTN